MVNAQDSGKDWYFEQLEQLHWHKVVLSVIIVKVCRYFEECLNSNLITLMH